MFASVVFTAQPLVTQPNIISFLMAIAVFKMSQIRENNNIPVRLPASHDLTLELFSHFSNIKSHVL